MKKNILSKVIKVFLREKRFDVVSTRDISEYQQVHFLLKAQGIGTITFAKGVFLPYAYDSAINIIELFKRYKYKIQYSSDGNQLYIPEISEILETMRKDGNRRVDVTQYFPDVTLTENEIPQEIVSFWLTISSISFMEI